MNIEDIETTPFYANISAKLMENPKTLSLLQNNLLKPGLYKILPNPRFNNYIINIPSPAGDKTVAVEFEFNNPQDKKNLDQQFGRASTHICYVKSVQKGGLDNFIFDLYIFADRCEELGKLSLLATAESLKNLQDKKHEVKAKELFEIAKKACAVYIYGEPYYIIQGDYSSTTASDSQEDDDSESPEDSTGSSADSQAQGAFVILCERNKRCYAIKVRQKNLTSTGEDKFFEVTGTIHRKNVQPASNYHLVKAELEFTDQKKAAAELNLKKLQELTEKSGSYLKAWKEYTGARGDRVLTQARNFDAPNYISCTPTSSDSVKLYFEEKIKDKLNASSVEEIILYKNGHELPEFLQDKKCSFLEYFEKKQAAEKERKKKGGLREKDVCCQVLHSGDNWIEVQLPDGFDMPTAADIPQTGFIVMSMKGEESQIERQWKAWKMITSGKSGISYLGNILEGNFDYMSPGNKVPSLKISNRVRQKIFENDPTPRQLEAIKLALETPDIAVIQGPPGTGKTTVVTAILEILNEAQDKRGVSAGQVLATSYQHDAVENMIERIAVNGLPTWKYGKRRDVKGDYNSHIDSWCKEIEEKVFALNPDIQMSSEEDTFHAYAADYIYSPSEENRQRLLEYILKLPVPENCAEAARKLLLKNDLSVSSGASSVLLKKIRSLRVTENAFKDDGLKRAEELYFSLDDKHWFMDHKNEEKLLQDIILDNKIDGENLAALSALKKELLEEFSPRPLYISFDKEESVVDLCKRVADALKELQTKKNQKEVIIADWIEALRAGQEAFAKAIKDCDFVYAATSQQSVGKDINRQKLAVSNGDFFASRHYDTVIIDEAARATPPDLLIPMCNAVKRIILVGDHRQLPQLVDDDLCSDVYKKVAAGAEEKSLDENYEDSFKLSLFEMLFKKLEELEKKDGIKRRITLDTQYRTHPVLGKFCSDEFYKAHNEDYKSVRPASDFDHQLPGIEHKAAVWIDVPESAGKEAKDGTSRIRECEADCIVEKLLEFVHSQENLPKDKKFSYGIIAFYRAQSDLIQAKLAKKKKELKDVNYKVGTVDAFQGMQFDVVFLSIVRSSGDINFLTPNRLCVSMSRQKKVLLAVGCKDFVTSKAARSQKIPALADFYDLCAGKNDEGCGAVQTWKK